MASNISHIQYWRITQKAKGICTCIGERRRPARSLPRPRGRHKLSGPPAGLCPPRSANREDAGMCLALDFARTPGLERVACRAPAFGVRQLAGAFARGTVDSEAAWLALADKSGDLSPQS